MTENGSCTPLKEDEMKNVFRLSLAVALLLVSFFSAPKEAHACDSCIEECLFFSCPTGSHPQCRQWSFPYCEAGCCP